MNEDIVTFADIICPKCRYMDSNKKYEYPIVLQKVFKREGKFIINGFFQCQNELCREVYPILMGVPIVLKNLNLWWASEKVKLFAHLNIPDELASFFQTIDIKNKIYQNEININSLYMDSHYGNLSPTSYESKSHNAYWQEIIKAIKLFDQELLNKSIDLGCSVGRLTFEKAKLAKLAIGIDMSFNMILAAVKIQQTQQITYNQKIRDNTYKRINFSYEVPDNVLFLVADALDPPFRANSFDQVSALNLLDNVSLPLILIQQMDALLEHKGNIILTSPYEWRDDICDQKEWICQKDKQSSDIVREILEGKFLSELQLKYKIITEIKKLDWLLRHHDRYWTYFIVHFIHAKKF